MAPRAGPDRYEPLPGLLAIPAHLLRRLSPRARRGTIVAGVVLVSAGAASLALAIPAIVTSKRERAAAEQRASARAHAARLAQLRSELRRVDGRGTRARGLHGTAALAARRALTADLAAAVQADAAQRAASGEFRHAPTRVECARFPRTPGAADPADDLTAARGRYSCLAVTADIAPQASTSGGTIGYPYRALVRFGPGRFSLCKVSGRPGEGSLLHAVEVAVPRACGGVGG